MKRTLLTILASLFFLTACDDTEKQQLTQLLKQTEKQNDDLKNELAAQYQEVNRLTHYVKQAQHYLLAKQQEIPQFYVEIERFFDKSTALTFSNDEQKTAAGQSFAEASLLVMTPKTQIAWLDNLVYRSIITLIHRLSLNKETLSLPAGQEKAKLQEMLTNFYQVSLEQAKAGKHQGFYHTIRSDYLGTRNNIMVFLISFTAYDADLGNQEIHQYVHIDLNTKQLIELDTLFNKSDKAKLKTLLWQKIEEAAQQTNTPLTLTQDAFQIPNNFYFFGGGIVFAFSPNQEIALFWNEVNGLINPKYRRSTKDGFMPPPEGYH